MPNLLVIRHNTANSFRIMRADGKSGPEVTLPAPDALTVEGRPNSHLLADLSWYLERFLDYPFPPNTALAEGIQAALRQWGETCFAQLFAGQALLWFEQARQAGLAQLTVKIASDDPRVLGWPWEVLRDPRGSTLAHSCRIERQLSALPEPLPLPDKLPADRLNILLIIARPYGERDVGYHALARPLVERVAERGLPVRIEVLRPPTFDQLQKHLRRRRGYYHLVHFDGHGGYGTSVGHPSAHSYRGVEGRLIFETDTGEPDPITAGSLTALLAEHRIPIMVLNACQSARVDALADDPFASVAAALLKAGMRSVVAMSYSLYVSAAERFVPAFYDRLLETGEVAEATRAGRQAMLRHAGRVCARGEYPLEDWLVPVLYQHDPLVLPVGALSAAAPAPDATEALPPEAQTLGDYGFIGRQRAIQALERAVLNQPQAALLVHGMAGVGKSTLARGYLQWLKQTHGLGPPEEGCRFSGALWLAFDDIRSAEFVINTLITALFGHAATAAPMPHKLTTLAQALRTKPFLIVWDNFESAAGIPETEVVPLLSAVDREQLEELIRALRGGKTKLLLTSRSPEPWLAVTAAYRLPLAGLAGEECWDYCNAVLADLERRPDRDDQHFKALLDALDGHPLALRAVLLRLGETTAEALLEELEGAFVGVKGDESTRRLFAALSLLDAGLPAAFAPALALIGLHRRHVGIDFLERMAKIAETPLPRATLVSCFAALEAGGLLHPLGQGVYRMHPALSGYLSAHRPATPAAQRAFVDCMGTFANQLTPQPRHAQRAPCTWHGANFHRALALAAARGMEQDRLALTQALAAFALNRRDFAAGRALVEALAEHWHEHDDQDGMAGAYHNLGIISVEQRDFAGAEDWCRKALAIFEKQGNEHDAARTYHLLGVISEEQRDFDRAKHWYQKALTIKERQGNEQSGAITYHHLGVIAEAQRDFAGAEHWYQKALTIKEKQGNERGAAITYHQLGMLAQKQSDFARAEDWYQKALAIFEKQNDEHYAAITYRQLGMLAQHQGDFARAEDWYQKALTIFEKQGNDHSAAGTYHQLGWISAAQTDFARAGTWFLRAIKLVARANDPHHFDQAIGSFVHTLQAADEASRAKLWREWQASGLDHPLSLDDLDRPFSEPP